MDMFTDGYFNHILEGLHGPGKFRFFVQPLIAIILGIRDGRLDAKSMRPPYFLSLLTASHHRESIAKDGFTSIMKPSLLAWVIDTLFQIFVLSSWNPFQAILVGFLLVALPYILTRGLTNRTMTGVIHGP